MIDVYLSTIQSRINRRQKFFFVRHQYLSFKINQNFVDICSIVENTTFCDEVFGNNDYMFLNKVCYEYEKHMYYM